MRISEQLKTALHEHSSIVNVLMQYFLVILNDIDK